MQAEPVIRHARMLAIHQDALDAYKEALRAVVGPEAGKPLLGTSDTRTISEIVAHIEAWDRFALMAAGDLLAGIRRPRMVVDLAGFVETDGTHVAFASIDAFNAYHAERARLGTWHELRERALRSATSFYALFEQPSLLNASRLEASDPHWKRLQNGVVLERVPMGWHLWLTMIEHIAVEHRPLIEWLAGRNG